MIKPVRNYNSNCVAVASKTSFQSQLRETIERIATKRSIQNKAARVQSQTIQQNTHCRDPDCPRQIFKVNE